MCDRQLHYCQRKAAWPMSGEGELACTSGREGEGEGEVAGCLQTSAGTVYPPQKPSYAPNLIDLADFSSLSCVTVRIQ